MGIGYRKTFHGKFMLKIMKINLSFIFIFFKNNLLKYIIIRLQNLKSYTEIAYIEPL
jgi:hypothetical protein